MMATESMETTHETPGGILGHHHKHDDDSHVHFPEDQFSLHESEIIVQTKTSDLVDVHLGFLQLNHRYDVNFTLTEHQLSLANGNVIADRLPHAHAHVMEIQNNGNGVILTVDLTAAKDKLMKETIVLRNSNDAEQCVKLILHARVLGKGKGTPSLKTGIKCTGVQLDDESEHSDWQGFD